MLFDATAVLIASLTVATVGGPVVLPENLGVSSSFSSAHAGYAFTTPDAHAVTSPAPHTLASLTSPAPHTLASLTSAPLAPMTPAPGRAIDLPTSLDQRSAPTVVAPALPLAAEQLATFSGSSLLHGLSALPPAAAADFVTTHPHAVHELLSSPPAAHQVTSWWAGLDATAQRSLIAATPEVVGNLDGVPFAVRNQANRALLRSTIRELELEADAAVGRAVATQNLHRLEMLYEVVDALGPAIANPPRSLLNLDTHGQGKAAVVLGDLETADYVSYMIPGMLVTVAGDIVGWTGFGARLYDDQTSWLALLAEAGAATQEQTVATVAWIGYQTPSLMNVGSMELAYEGRDAIAAAIEGLQTLRADDPPFVSLLTHSYGSTAALLALEDDTTVDALAMVGSPGSPAQSVDELNVRGDVFVGEAAWDPIPNSAFFGSDPGAPSYGARVMSVLGSVDVITNEVLAGSAGHNEYWVPGTESMRNLALIAIDRGELVTDGSALDAGRTLAMLH
ncbi:alpha/beta hydrolase [Chryseoglobus sp. 28M-23]|uniref:alpha/beta hydrolase n=1 Tax=Chryseoglobus sp. 28M-23 TaxID=2772253 RepID=UPI00174683C5|nr:alpha/beta hydrolase [Chryseoglobus sp. 28M-23]QOD93090.1 hypothetical protein IE160_09095 [Chryseoglobus sp. 28M-23]